jgi:hypothetical protein
VINRKVKVVGISLFPQHVEMLRAISEANGGLGRSAAFRMVLERFVRQEKMVDIVKAEAGGLITPKEAMDQLKLLVRTRPTQRTETVRGEHAEVAKAEAGAS